MRLILLAGYKNTSPDNCPWLQAEGGLCRLEIAAREALALASEPIVVLATDVADHALRACRSLEKCELVFDTNGTDVSLLTNLRAGLKIGPDPALAIPAEFVWPSADHVRRMRLALLQAGATPDVHIMQDVDIGGALLNSGFPLGITLTGRKQILNLNDLVGLTDPRLIYKRLALDQGEQSTSTINPTCLNQ